MTQVLDKGFVELLDHMGSDLTVVNAARVSFSKQSTWKHKVGDVCLKTDGLYFHNVLRPEDVKLIRYLAKHEHWTPFGHPQLQFRMKMPIFCARQFMRSNIGIVYNEVSRRYIDSPPEFYEPKEWRARPVSSMKQGSGSALLDEESETAKWCNHDAFSHASQAYEAMLESNVAPELARMVLPLSTYTEFWATMSLAACARIVRLRNDPHAQWEIQQYANAISDLARPVFPVSWAALMEVKDA